MLRVFQRKHQILRDIWIFHIWPRAVNNFVRLRDFTSSKSNLLNWNKNWKIQTFAALINARPSRQFEKQINLRIWGIKRKPVLSSFASNYWKQFWVVRLSNWQKSYLPIKPAFVNIHIYVSIAWLFFWICEVIGGGGFRVWNFFFRKCQTVVPRM